MRLIIYDFEVFKFDTLFGAFILENGKLDYFKTWDLTEIKEFYEQNTKSIWIGHNIEHYDNHILEAVVRGKNPKKTSDEIIKLGMKKRLNIDLYYYDLMAQSFVSLKVTEAYAGKKISVSNVDFDLDRHLTNEEKRLTEEYNFDDLEQSLDNFIEMYSTFELRLNLIAEYNFPLTYLPLSGTRIAEKVLKAEKIHGIESWVVKPKKYDNLQLKNERLLDFYLNERFITGEKLKIDVCDVEHTIGVGGIHGARSKYYGEKLMYFDVSGYYNLIMILYDLLPRSMPKESKKLYKQMYFEQLAMKKTNPKKRSILKIVLLSVFGAMLNEHTAFYDPYHGRLVTLTGQIFLVDLLEKLEGKIELVQSNTDGIIVKALVDEQIIIDIVDEWRERTGFSLKVETIDKLIQRDVNNYIMLKDGDIVVKGEAVKNYNSKESVYWYGSYNSKEPSIIDNCIVDYYIHNIMPEETVAKYKSNITMFQYVAKKLSFDRLELQEDFADGLSRKTVVQSVNRVFASKDKQVKRMLYKCRDEGKVKRVKVASLPENIFVYNEEVKSDEAVKYLMERIDYDYYVKRAYKRIAEFMYIPKLKKIIL